MIVVLVVGLVGAGDVLLVLGGGDVLELDDVVVDVELVDEPVVVDVVEGGGTQPVPVGQIVASTFVHP